MPPVTNLCAQGVEIERSTLASWVGKAAHELKPAHDALLTHLKTSSKLFMDETPAPVLDPGRGKVMKGYFWAPSRDDRGWTGPEPPSVAFTYAPGRSGTYASQILQGFEGILQVDGYAGYNRVLDPRDNAPIQLAYCWAHARRKLYELTENNVAPIAEAGLKQIAASNIGCSKRPSKCQLSHQPARPSNTSPNTGTS